MTVKDPQSVRALATLKRRRGGDLLAEVARARQHAGGRRGQRALSQAVREVSTALGNTPTVARKSYIDPRVISLFEEGIVIDFPIGHPRPASHCGSSQPMMAL